jgi:hypothetical protein
VKTGDVDLPAKFEGFIKKIEVFVSIGSGIKITRNGEAQS